MTGSISFGPPEHWKMGTRRKRCHIPILLDGKPVGEIYGIQNDALSHDMSYRVEILGDNLGRFYDLNKAKESALDAITRKKTAS